MGILFLSLIGLYLTSYIFNLFNISFKGFNFNPYINIIQKYILGIFKNSKIYLLNLIKKINKFILSIEVYSPLLRARKYLLIAATAHLLILFYFSNYIIFSKTKNEENWTYTEISTKDIEEKIIAESAPNEPNNFSEPDFIEDSEDNEPNSSMSNGVDIFSEKIEIPTEVIIPAPAPVIISKFSKININFKPEESQEKIKWGKEIIYNEGKIIGINGFGSNGKGSSLEGRGSGNGNGNGLKEGKVFGTNIKAKKLGVIFDISFSMSPYTERVEKEIKKNFPNAIIYYVDGCSIDSQTKSIKAFEILTFENVDSIYWFCDLQDPQTKDGLYFLEDLLKTRRVRLYIKSMDKHPNSKLKSIISSTGGNYSFGLN